MRSIFIIFIGVITISAITSAKPFVLEVYGNANMDGCLNDRDISYTYGVIQGQLFETRYTDANHDGKIDLQDIYQIKKMISGTAREIIIEDETFLFKRLHCHKIKIPWHMDHNFEHLHYWGKNWIN